MTKVSLIYLAFCATVSATAFGVMINVDHNSGELSGNQAYPAAQALLQSAQLTIDNLPQPNPKVPVIPANQQAAAAFEQGEAARLANNPNVALDFYSTAIGISQKAGLHQFESTVWQSVAKAYAQAQDYQQAEINYKKAITLAKSSRHTELLGVAQAELAQLYVSQGNLKRALPLYRTALVRLRRNGEHQAAQQVVDQTQKLELALKPTASASKPAKSKQPATIKPVQVAIAPEAIVMPETASPQPLVTPPINDVFLTSDNDPEPPMLMDMTTIVQPVSNDAI